MKWSNQLVVFFNLIEDLKAQPIHVLRLAEKYNVHYRTMYRYINILKDSGIDVRKNLKGNYYIVQSSKAVGVIGNEYRLGQRG